MAIRVILVDDHPIVLSGLRQLFESSPDFAVVGSCSHGEQALETLQSQEADVVCACLGSPGSMS